MNEERDFWTRRRAAVAAEEKAETAALRDASAEDERARLDRLSDDELLEELNLPEPESLSSGDDFSAFMQQAVPERLRRRALRALWQTDPVLANVDGLVDYGEDFTDKATVVADLQTAYRVGKGMVAHLEKLSSPKTDPEPPEDALQVPEEADEQFEQTPENTDHEPEEEEGEIATAPAPRRMVFAFDGETE